MRNKNKVGIWVFSDNGYYTALNERSREEFLEEDILSHWLNNEECCFMGRYSIPVKNLEDFETFVKCLRGEDKEYIKINLREYAVTLNSRVH